MTKGNFTAALTLQSIYFPNCLLFPNELTLVERTQQKYGLLCTIASISRLLISLYRACNGIIEAIVLALHPRTRCFFSTREQSLHVTAP